MRKLESRSCVRHRGEYEITEMKGERGGAAMVVGLKQLKGKLDATLKV